MKKVLSILLSLIICMSFMPVAEASTEYIEGNYTYTVKDGKATIVSFPERVSGVVNIPSKLGGYPVVEIGAYSFYACTTITKVTVPNTVNTIGNYAFAYCVELEYIKIPSSVTKFGNKVFQTCGDVVFYCSNASKALAYAKSNGIDYVIIAEEENIYNLGEETYSFDNFSDAFSGGHCFGMSVTSSGYYIGSLDKVILGGDDGDVLFSFERTSAVQAPICHYHKIQGAGPEQNSMVAGGSIDLRYEIDTRRDWNECVNYVRSHELDNSGSLQIGMWYDGGGGHAVNFLYYDNVGGQDRIYAYDNNFPDIETYYFMGNDGLIYQAPEQTVEAGIIGLDLMDVNNYFSEADEFEMERHIYADKDEILVEKATVSNMKTLLDVSKSVIFELPKDVDTIKIVPLVDYAEFDYLDKTYSFGKVDEDTYAELTVSESEYVAPEFEIINGDTPVECSCKCHKGGIIGFFYKIIRFFQKLFGINKVCECGVKH